MTIDNCFLFSCKHGQIDIVSIVPFEIVDLCSVRRLLFLSLCLFRLCLNRKLFAGLTRDIEVLRGIPAFEAFAVHVVFDNVIAVLFETFFRYQILDRIDHGQHMLVKHEIRLVLSKNIRFVKAYKTLMIKREIIDFVSDTLISRLLVVLIEIAHGTENELVPFVTISVLLHISSAVISRFLISVRGTVVFLADLNPYGLDHLVNKRILSYEIIEFSQIVCLSQRQSVISV